MLWRNINKVLSTSDKHSLLEELLQEHLPGVYLFKESSRPCLIREVFVELHNDSVVFYCLFVVLGDFLLFVGIYLLSTHLQV